MNDNGKNPSNPSDKETWLHKTTSNRMATQLWQEFRDKRGKDLKGSDLVYRLRLAHMLLLHFQDVYYSPTHKAPTITSEQYLVQSVLSLHNPVTWCTVRNKSD